MRIAIETIAAAAAGGFLALLVVSLIDPHGQMAMDAVVLVGGALAGAGLDRWWRR